MLEKLYKILSADPGETIFVPTFKKWIEMRRLHHHTSFIQVPADLVLVQLINFILTRPVIYQERDRPAGGLAHQWSCSVISIFPYR